MIKPSVLFRLFILTVLIASPIVGIHGGPYQQWISAQEHIAKGKEALAKDDFTTAYWEIESARIQDPTLPEPYLLFAQLRKKQGRLEDAIVKLEAGVHNIPDNPNLHYALTDLLWRTGNSVRAATEADAAYNLGERLGGLYILLGNIKMSGNTISGNYQATQEERSQKLNDAYGDAIAMYKEAINVLSSSNEKISELRHRIAIVDALRADIRNQRDPSYKRAAVVSFPRPDYIEEARTHKIHGTVSLAIVVSETGTVTDVVTLTGLGYGLDEAAIDAARKVEFSPAMKAGKSIPSCTLMKISFTLL